MYVREPLVPPGVVTVTGTAPMPECATALSRVSLRTLNVAGLAPKATTVAVVKPLPVRVTLLPPTALPLVGDKPVSVGVLT